MFESFTDEARGVLSAAGREAITLQHSWVGTEHLLLGVLADPEVAEAFAEHDLNLDAVRARIAEILAGHERMTDAQALATLGIDLEAVRARTDAAFGPGSLKLPDSEPPPFTPRSKRVLEAALAAATDFGQEAVNPWHIALGLLWPGIGGVAQDVVSEEAAGGVEAVTATLEEGATRQAPADARPTVDPEDVIWGMQAFQQLFSLTSFDLKAWIHRNSAPMEELRERVEAGASVLVDAREAGDQLTRYVDVARGFAAALGLVMWPLDKGVYLLHPRHVRVDQATRRKILGL